MLRKAGGAAAAQAQRADDTGFAPNGRQRFVHRHRMRFEPQPTERALLLGDRVAQHRLTVANFRERSVDRLRLLTVRPDVRVVRLKQNGAPGVVADHLCATIEHKLERLLHRLPRGLLDELVHQRVAGGLLARKGDGMGARQLGAGAQSQRGGQAAVVLGEHRRPAAEQDKAAQAISDRHRCGDRSDQVQVVGQVVEELLQDAVAFTAERLAGSTLHLDDRFPL